MKRREFITLIGGTAAWPIAARAQQPARLCHVSNRSSDRCKAGDIGHPDRFRGGVGPGRHRSGREPGATRGNVTGLSLQFTDLAGKRLELLREVLPDLRRLAILANASSPATALEVAEVHAMAGTFGLEVVAPEVRRPEDIAPTFEALKGRVEPFMLLTIRS